MQTMDNDAADPKDGPEQPTDVVLLHARTDDGAGYRAVRAREGRVELAELRPAKEGKPLQGAELVSLRPRSQFPLLCDVKVLYDGNKREARDEEPSGTPSHEGPARVTSRSYRANWDAVFRDSPKEKKRGAAN